MTYVYMLPSRLSSSSSLATMPRDPVLFSTLWPLSERCPKLENPHYYYGGPHLGGTRREHIQQAWGDINTASSYGGVKVEDNCLLLEFQGNTMDLPSSMSTCSIDPTSRISSSASSSSSCTFLSFPSSSSNPFFCNPLNQENLSACEFPPFVPPPDLTTPSSSQPCVSPELLGLELANNLEPLPSLDPSLSLEPCFVDIPNACQALITNPNEACFDDDLSSLISNTLHSYTAEGPPVQEPFCVTHDELSINDIVAQESFGTSSSLGGGCPKASLAITDDCSDLLGSSRQHQSLLQDNLHLHVLQGSGNIYKMQRYHSSSALDAFGSLNLSHCDSDGELLPPSMCSSIMNGEPSITELEKAYLYNFKDLKELTFNGVESVFSDIPQSQEFYQYTKEEKGKRIDRYRRKRNERNFSKKIKYACRKTLADSRPRIRGRFAKTDDTGGWM